MQLRTEVDSVELIYATQVSLGNFMVWTVSMLGEGKEQIPLQGFVDVRKNNAGTELRFDSARQVAEFVEGVSMASMKSLTLKKGKMKGSFSFIAGVDDGTGERDPDKWPAFLEAA